MVLLQRPHFPLYLPVSQQAEGGKYSWEIIVVKSEAITWNEAVFDWDKYPGSNNWTSAGWLRVRIPKCDSAKGPWLFDMEGHRKPLWLRFRLWMLRWSWAHLGSCSVFTSVAVWGASSYSLKGQSEMRASVRPLCPVGQSHQADLECQWRPRNFWVFSGQISLSLTRKTDCLTNSWTVSLKAPSQFSVTSWHGCNVFFLQTCTSSSQERQGEAQDLGVHRCGAEGPGCSWVILAGPSNFLDTRFPIRIMCIIIIMCICSSQERGPSMKGKRVSLAVSPWSPVK